jgi:hypothetical protein
VSGAGLYRVDIINYTFKHYFVILKSLSFFFAALVKGKLQTEYMAQPLYVRKNYSSYT